MNRFRDGLKIISPFFLLLFFVMLAAVPINKSLAVNAERVTVNGIDIYNATNPAYEGTAGYNSAHGISGVSYNTTNHTLDLTGATIESIYANGDLVVNVSGNNAIDAVTSNIAVEAQGNLTIIGVNGASLNIMAMSADDRAIEIAPAARLTIGDEANLGDLITVSIQRGRNVNTEDTYIVTGNTYNYTEPGGGEPGPEPGNPLVLSIGGTVVIDETADPQITSNAGEGWSIEQGWMGMGMYGLDIEQGVNLGHITGTGDGSLIITGDANIGENEDGFSINMAGRVDISGGMSDVAGDLNLAGGIYTQGKVSTYDRDFTIGSAETPSTKGVVANEVEASMGDLTIYTSGTALEYYNPAPAEGEGMLVGSTAGKALTVAESNIATANVVSVRVSGGGTIDLNYATSLGTFTPEASHWPWTDMTGTEEENPEPITVNCEEGTDVANKYIMTSSEGNFLLESTAGTLYQLGWNIPGADDSIVTNGTVRVIAANGYRFTSGGYTDYSIEAGSTVTIELLPDYGYQYVAGGLNGNQTMPDEGKASYTFEMPNNHLHLSAIFEPKSDLIEVSDPSIKAATIEIPSGEINGNAELTVSDTTEADESAFEAAAGNLNVANYLNLNLNEVIYKGTEEEAWRTPITELGQEMTVNLELDENLQGYTDYTMLREHEGVITEVETDYNPETGVLSFQTDAYSDYALAHGERAINPDTYDGIAKYFYLVVASVVGMLTLIIIAWQKRSRATI